jgi:hypothetical protein
MACSRERSSTSLWRLDDDVLSSYIPGPGHTAPRPGPLSWSSGLSKGCNPVGARSSAGEGMRRACGAFQIPETHSPAKARAPTRSWWIGSPAEAGSYMSPGGDVVYPVPGASETRTVADQAPQGCAPSVAVRRRGRVRSSEASGREQSKGDEAFAVLPTAKKRMRNADLSVRSYRVAGRPRVIGLSSRLFPCYFLTTMAKVSAGSDRSRRDGRPGVRKKGASSAGGLSVVADCPERRDQLRIQNAKF